MTNEQILSLLKMNNRAGIKFLYEKYKISFRNIINDSIPGLSEQKVEEIMLLVMIQVWLFRNEIPQGEGFFKCLASIVKNEIQELASGTFFRKQAARKTKVLI